MSLKPDMLKIIKTLIAGTNIIITLFLAWVMYQGTMNICWEQKAREFIRKLDTLPISPWQTPILVSILLFVILFSIFFRDRNKPKPKYTTELLLLSDLLLCIGIIYLLNISYKGIILLVIINTLSYVENKREKYLFTAILMVIYIIFDYDLLKKILHITSINEYIYYHSSISQFYIYGIKSILSSLNEILFILFLVLTVQKQIEEKREIRELFSKLMKTTEELKVVNIQLDDYAKRSEEMAKTQERNRLAREIHDTIGHTLTGIVTGLEACKALIKTDIDKAVKLIDRILELGKNGLLDVRRSVKELRPDALERFSLIPALMKMVADINDCTNTKVIFTIDGEFQNLYSDEEEALYRAIQESITNAVRHGEAKNIIVTLKESDGNVELNVSDDGKGSDSVKEGFGLKHIRERVEMLNGTVLFEPSDVGGFEIYLSFSLRKRKK